MFSVPYKVYEVATNIWVRKSHISEGDMKDAISALESNRLSLEAELKSEEQILEKFSSEQTQALVIQSSSQFRY